MENVRLENVNGETTREIGVDGRIILKWIFINRM
jgi:hypothetical protein